LLYSIALYLYKPSDMKPKVIAIDGHSSTGKSSLAKKIAKALGYVHIDTGAIYRAVALFAIENNMISKDKKIAEKELNQALPEIHINFEMNESTGVNEVRLNGRNVEDKIRSMEVSNVVSQVAKLPEIRKHLVKLQREIAQNTGVVMDGRDIGSVVFPAAPVKIFLTASPQVRASRRYQELRSNGVEISMEEVEKNINQRDFLDTQRSASPLIKADDAIEINNDFMDQQGTFQTVMNIIREKGF